MMPMLALPLRVLHRLLRETFEPEMVTPEPRLSAGATTTIVEVGPRMAFSTAFSTNAVSITSSVGINQVRRCLATHDRA